jgi:hypothetical protein
MEKTKEGCVGCEAGTCFMARNVSEKYVPNTTAPRTLGAGAATLMYAVNVHRQVAAESYTLARGVLTPSCLLVFFKYFPRATRTEQYGFTGQSQMPMGGGPVDCGFGEVH